MIDLNKMLELAKEAVILANAAILEVYHSEDFEVEAKGDLSPLTRADRKSHQIISQVLEPSGLPILSEEGRNIPYEERRSWDYFWMVDPLDGTKEFLKKNGEFTVNIAIIHQQQPILGVVGIPVSGVIYYSAVGVGAFKISNGVEVELVAHQALDLRKEGIRVVASRSHMDERTMSFVETLNNPRLVSKGSSLKFMLLVDGEADIYPRFAPTMEWDVAASHAILNQVGINLISTDDNQPLKYNKVNLLNSFFKSFA